MKKLKTFTAIIILFMAFLSVVQLGYIPKVYGTGAEVLILDTRPDGSQAHGLNRLHPTSTDFKYSALGQTFVLSKPYNLTKAQFRVYILGSPYGLAYVRLYYSDSSGQKPNGTLIATSTNEFNVSDVEGGYYNFTMNNVPLTSNTNYSIVFCNPESGLVNDANYVRIYRTSEDLHDGNCFSWYGSVNNWQAHTSYDTAIALYGIGDDESPTYGTPSHNTTKAGSYCKFECPWYDNVGLKEGKLEHNNTGSYQNETVVSLSGKSDTAIDYLTLNTTVGTKVRYRWHGKDTSDNENTTGWTTITITATDPPYYTTYGNNASWANRPTLLYCHVFDDEGLDIGGAEHNNTGTLQNQTISLSGTDDWINITITLNATLDNVIAVRFPFNDTSGTPNCTTWFYITCSGITITYDINETRGLLKINDVEVSNGTSDTYYYNSELNLTQRAWSPYEPKNMTYNGITYNNTDETVYAVANGQLQANFDEISTGGGGIPPLVIILAPVFLIAIGACLGVFMKRRR